MPVLVKPTKTTLAWSDFQLTSETFDDGVAEAGFKTGFPPSIMTRKVAGLYYLPDPFIIRILHRARVNKDADQTDELLAHEQLHFDLGIVCANALARDLDGLSATSAQALANAFDALRRLHVDDRADDISRAYDEQTKHGKDQKMQCVWQAAMAECLARPSMTRLMGYLL